MLSGWMACGHDGRLLATLRFVCVFVSQVAAAASAPKLVTYPRRHRYVLMLPGQYIYVMFRRVLMGVFLAKLTAT